MKASTFSHARRKFERAGEIVAVLLFGAMMYFVLAA